MEAFGFQTLDVPDGNDLVAIGAAIEQAKLDTTRPSFITIHTEIGYGCPAKQGKASAHGEPLGVENVAAMKENLGWENQEAFYVPDDVYKHYEELAKERAASENTWNLLFEDYCKAFPEMKELWDRYHNDAIAEELWEDESYWTKEEKAQATRALSGMMINRLKDKIPALMGGSADLAPSNKTEMKGEATSRRRITQAEIYISACVNWPWVPLQTAWRCMVE